MKVWWKTEAGQEGKAVECIGKGGWTDASQGPGEARRKESLGANEGLPGKKASTGFHDGTAGTELSSSGLKRRKDRGQAGSTVRKVPLQSVYFIKSKRNNAHEVGSFTGLAYPSVLVLSATGETAVCVEVVGGRKFQMSQVRPPGETRVWVGIGACPAGEGPRRRWRAHRVRILSATPVGTPKVSAGAKDIDPGPR